MSAKQANITIPVDLTNPGQFFACCGLLELADRLWPGTEGWFDKREFCILTGDGAKTLSELLSEARSTIFHVGDDSESEEDDGKDDDLPVEPQQSRPPLVLVEVGVVRGAAVRLQEGRPVGHRLEPLLLALFPLQHVAL